MARRISAPIPKKERYETFEELYEEFWDPLHKQFYYMDKDFHLAEDMAQETMLRVWQYWDRLQWDKLGGAIGTIANRVRYGQMRKEMGRPDDQLYDDILEFECHDEGITDPVREVMNHQASEIISGIFDKLREEERELFSDVYLRNLSIAEVAEKHEITKPHVYVKLYRIRDQLIGRLDRYDIDTGSE